MNIIGEIKLILNSKLLIVRSDQDLYQGEKLSVFYVFDDPKLIEHGIDGPIVYPKGEIQIIGRQAGQFYLAEPFRQIKNVVRKVTEPSSSFSSWQSIITQVQGSTKEIIDEVPGEWSARVDENQSLKIKIPETIQMGDRIGRIG